MTKRALRKLTSLRGDTASMGPATLRGLAAAATSCGAKDLAQAFWRARGERFPDAEALPLLRARFPGTYVARLRREAKAQRIDVDLPAALTLQESGFRVNAVSAVGALGLMQLMPETARDLMHEDNRRAAPTTEDVLDPATNVRLGVRYLARMLRAFDRRVEYALAAYNAGPGAVTRWRQSRGDLPVDIFVEEIPYAETRDYVGRVLGNRQTLHVLATIEQQPVAGAEVAELGPKP
jgi:soluble lytic murein transglycosylase